MKMDRTRANPLPGPVCFENLKTDMIYFRTWGRQVNALLQRKPQPLDILSNTEFQ
jgi:hypothetical protein